MKIELERYKRLPMNAAEVWQGTLVEAPVRVDPKSAKRPQIALWISPRTGAAGRPVMCAPGQAPEDAAIEALIALSDEALKGTRPGVLEVRGAALAAHLREALAGTGMRIVENDSIPLFDAMFELMTQQMVAVPGPLNGKGVTPEAMRGFAEAAALFFKAEPWIHLTDEDLIEVESPKAPKGMRFISVLGCGGQTFGLGFYGDPDECWDIRRMAGDPGAWLESRRGGAWSLTFGSETETPPPDLELWDRENLPKAEGEWFPVLAKYMPGGEILRADAATLGYVESLLRALAVTTESQIDTGRWEHTVTRPQGATPVRLSLPDLLNPPDFDELRRRGYPLNPRVAERSTMVAARWLEQRGVTDMKEADRLLQQEFVGKRMDYSKYPGSTAEERAMDLCYDAMDSIGRRELLLLRQAIEIFPDCAEAYLQLADRQSDPERSERLCRRALDAARRTLGEKYIEDNAGEFWQAHETRPYMRALDALASSLCRQDRMEEAIELYREMLRLNPNDNLGVRDTLLPMLMEYDRDAEVEELFKAYPEDGSALWCYARAIFAFRESGATQETMRLRREAVEANPMVIEAVRDLEFPPYDGGPMAMGSPEEAAWCAEQLEPLFQVDPGLVDWFLRESEAKQAGSRTRAAKKPGKRKGKSKSR